MSEKVVGNSDMIWKVIQMAGVGVRGGINFVETVEQWLGDDSTGQQGKATSLPYCSECTKEKPRTD